MDDRFQAMVSKIKSYNKLRHWNQAPADLAKSIVIEAAELLEHFQWDESSKKDWKEQLQKKDLHEIGFEVADIMWYIITFCYQSGIDILSAMEEKYEHNERKYPAEKFTKGHNDTFYKSQKAKYRSDKKKD